LVFYDFPGTATELLKHVEDKESVVFDVLLAILFGRKVDDAAGIIEEVESNGSVTSPDLLVEEVSLTIAGLMTVGLVTPDGRLSTEALSFVYRWMDNAREAFAGLEEESEEEFLNNFLNR